MKEDDKGDKKAKGINEGVIKTNESREYINVLFEMK